MVEIKAKVKEGLIVEATIGNHKITSDQSIQHGGTDTSPNPYEYFLASIAMCKMYYANKFCIERNIDPKEVEIILTTEGTFENLTIVVNIKFGTNFPEKYQKAVIKVVEQCTVKKVIQSAPNFKVITN